MTQPMTIPAAPVAGFVDRGSNYAAKQARLKAEEEEIKRLEEEMLKGKSPVEEPEEEEAEEGQESSEVNTNDNESKVDEDSEEEEDNLSEEEKSFKKRYGDLRRHSQKTIDALKKELEEAKTSVATPPENESELSAWIQKYPEAASMIEALADKKVRERTTDTEERVRRLTEAQEELSREKAEAAILKVHPDFDKLKGADEFHDWLETQPKTIQDMVYENENRADEVIRVVDLYKADNGLVKAAVTKKKKAAASLIGKGQRTKVAEEGGKTYSESQVEKMSAKEFEEAEADIMKAMQEGRFKYDLR